VIRIVMTAGINALVRKRIRFCLCSIKTSLHIAGHDTIRPSRRVFLYMTYLVIYKTYLINGKQRQEI
jgi:hypothetical protein